MELRYDVVCQAGLVREAVRASGSVFVRHGGEVGYRKIALAPAGGTVLGATVDVPAKGVSYYAVIDDGAAASMTVPAAGAAPQRAWAVLCATPVSLGTHTFGRVRKADGRAVAGDVGQGAALSGCSPGASSRASGPRRSTSTATGTSSCSTRSTTGSRAIRPEGAPSYTAIAFAGGEGDLAVGADGTAYVLDQGAEPVVRGYTPSGALGATTAVHGTGADMLRSGPAGTFLHGYPGDMWKPIAGGVGLS